MPSKRKTLRWIELIAVLAVIVVATLLLFPYIKYNLLPTLPTTCVDNLKQWATIFSMYREENMYAMPPIQGFQPFGPAENAKGCLNVHDEYSFSPEWGAIYPDYAATPLVLVCPEGPYLSPPEKKGPIVTRPWRPNEQVFGVLESESFWSCEDEGAITNADASYTYLGWRIEPNNPYDILITPELAAKLNLPASGPASVVALLAYLRVPEGGTYQEAQSRKGDSFELRKILRGLGPEYWSRAGSQQGGALMRMYMGYLFGEQVNDEGTPVGLSSDTPPPPDRPYYKTTPVMWDTIYQNASGEPQFTHNSPNGLNVLYMDGHVEFVAYPGPFPASKDFATMRAIVP